MRHGELVNRIDDDPNLGPGVGAFDVGYHDQEEVGRAEGTPDLGRFEVDGVRFVPKVHLELKEAIQAVDGIGSDTMLSAKVEKVLGVTTEYEASQLQAYGLLVVGREAARTLADVPDNRPLSGGFVGRSCSRK